ncbi:MAG TPA: RNA-binding protein [Clostridia bacterium]|nr:RNA-binding protein [Clostridia bacterium]
MADVKLNDKLYIGNLSPSVSEDDLRLLFSKTGPVTEVKLMLDPVTNLSRGFAYVTMATPELAAAALRDFHCYHLGGRHITVTEARPPQEPKGTMREGFDLGVSTPFRPAAPKGKTRRHSHRSSRGRSRGR